MEQASHIAKNGFAVQSARAAQKGSLPRTVTRVVVGGGDDVADCSANLSAKLMQFHSNDKEKHQQEIARDK